MSPFQQTTSLNLKNANNWIIYINLKQTKKENNMIVPVAPIDLGAFPKSFAKRLEELETEKKSKPSK